MRRITLWSIVLSCSALAAVCVAPAQTPEAAPATLTLADADPPPPPPPPPMVTIAKGEHSNWGQEQPDFAGADLLIRSPDAWVTFWRMHTGEPVPPPPVDFGQQVVIAVVQGWQPTGCGPNIAIVAVRPAEAFAEIVIVDDERPGDCDVVTNPFHVVAVPRELLPPHAAVAFKHMRPMPETGAVLGRVFAAPPEHEPMPLHGAHVVLLRECGEPLETMSGQDGSYFFVNVPPGEYVLIAEHPDFEPAEIPLGVPPNGRVMRDFFLTPMPPPPAGEIVGRVLGGNPDGEPFPLPRALVRLLRDGEEVDQRLTNEEGLFHFEPVPVGEYVMVATHEGFLPQEFLAVVEAGGVVEHVFVLPPAPPPGAFVGRVQGVLDEGNVVPIQHALVRLLGPDGEVAHARTNRLGCFVMPHIAPGAYIAVAEALGWLPDETEVEIRPGEPTEHIFHLQRP